METKQVDVNGKKFIVKEILAKDFDNINFEDKKTAAKMQIQLATGMSDAEYDALTMKERIHIFQAMNQLNGLEDFRKASS